MIICDVRKAGSIPQYTLIPLSIGIKLWWRKIELSTLVVVVLLALIVY